MAGIDRDFGEFADAQSSRLLGLAYALTGNPHDAADLVQETLVVLGQLFRGGEVALGVIHQQLHQVRAGRTSSTAPAAISRRTSASPWSVVTRHHFHGGDR